MQHIAHRGYNNDSGLVYRACGKSQYGKEPVFAVSVYPVPQYENAENIKDTLETMGKPAPVHDGSKPITLPPQTKFEGDLEEDAQEFSLPPAI